MLFMERDDVAFKEKKQIGEAIRNYDKNKVITINATEIVKGERCTGSGYRIRDFPAANKFQKLAKVSHFLFMPQKNPDPHIKIFLIKFLNTVYIQIDIKYERAGMDSHSTLVAHILLIRLLIIPDHGP